MIFLAGVGLGAIIGLVAGVVITAGALLWARMQNE